MVVMINVAGSGRLPAGGCRLAAAGWRVDARLHPVPFSMGAFLCKKLTDPLASEGSWILFDHLAFPFSSLKSISLGGIVCS